MRYAGEKQLAGDIYDYMSAIYNFIVCLLPTHMYLQKNEEKD
jgi:hypothetical protein